MDPLSISVSCITLITTITQVSVAVTNFIREVRDARGDLDAISRELVSLKSVLELLAEDTEGPHSATLPERLKDQIIDILRNCKHVVTDVETSLRKHSASRLGKSGHWAVGGGKGDMAKFRSSLETYKTALGLTLDMVAITITRDIRDDTQEIRKDTAAIKDDTALILEQIAQLQAQLPHNIMKDTSNHMIHRYLDDLSNFAELMSNSSKDESGTSTIMNSEDEDETVSSPDSIPKDPEVSYRRSSSLLSEMYAGSSDTSISHNVLHHIPGVPFDSPALEHEPKPTGTSNAGTTDQPFATRQDDDSPQPCQACNLPPMLRRSSDTSKGDEPPLSCQNSTIPPISHSKSKRTTKNREILFPWTPSKPLPIPRAKAKKRTTKDRITPPRFFWNVVFCAWNARPTTKFYNVNVNVNVAPPHYNFAGIRIRSPISILETCPHRRAQCSTSIRKKLYYAPSCHTSNKMMTPPKKTSTKETRAPDSVDANQGPPRSRRGKDRGRSSASKRPGKETLSALLFKS